MTVHCILTKSEFKKMFCAGTKLSKESAEYYYWHCNLKDDYDKYHQGVIVAVQK